MSFEVRIPDSIENTELDCQYFTNREDAVRAATIVAAEFSLPGLPEDMVSESACEATLSFKEWNERGW